jgi:hypothetical protein
MSLPTTIRTAEPVVDAAAGARLLGVSPGRFARLARGGCFSPAAFRLGAHRLISWRYTAAELRAFGRRHPDLLTGPPPAPLRRALRRGEDWRPRRWRARRVAWLACRAPSRWSRAAALAAVLDPPSLAQAVPDGRERAVLYRLRPALLDDPRLAAGPPEVVRALLTASDPEEARWYRDGLARLMAAVRAAPLPEAAPVRRGLRRSP